MLKIRPLLRCAALIPGLATVTPVTADAQTRVDNIATLSFDGANGRVSVQSNLVSLNVEARAQGDRPSLKFRLLPVGYELAGTHCDLSPHHDHLDYIARPGGRSRPCARSGNGGARHERCR